MNIEQTETTTTIKVTKYDIVVAEKKLDEGLHVFESMDIPATKGACKVIREAQAEIQAWMAKIGISKGGGYPDKGREAWTEDDLRANRIEQAYPALCRRVSHMIEAYHEDLTEHDRKQIEADPTVPFIHFTRKYGTHMVMLYPADHRAWPARDEAAPYMFVGPRQRITHLDGINDWVQALVNRDALIVHYFNEESFSVIREEEAVKIARAHVKAVKKTWETEA